MKNLWVIIIGICFLLPCASVIATADNLGSGTGISIISPDNNDYTNQTKPDISARFVCVKADTVKMFLNDDNVTADCTINEGNGTITLNYHTTVLADGQYILKVNGTRCSPPCEEVEAQIVFTIDTIPPIVRVDRIQDSDGDGFPEANELLKIFYTAHDTNLKEVWIGTSTNTSAIGMLPYEIKFGNVNKSVYAIDRAGNINQSAPFHLFNNYLTYYYNKSCGQFAGMNLSKCAAYDYFKCAKAIQIVGPDCQMICPCLGKLTKEIIPGCNFTFDNRKDDPIPAGALPPKVDFYTTPTGKLDFCIKVPNVNNATILIGKPNCTMVDCIINNKPCHLSKDSVKSLFTQSKIVMYGKDDEHVNKYGYAIGSIDNDGNINIEKQTGSVTAYSGNLAKTIRANYLDITDFKTCAIPAITGKNALKISDLGAGEYVIIALCMEEDQIGVITLVPFFVTKQNRIIRTDNTSYRIGEPVVVNADVKGRTIAAAMINNTATYCGDIRINLTTISRNSLENLTLFTGDGSPLQRLCHNIWIPERHGRSGSAKDSKTLKIPTDGLYEGKYCVMMFLENDGNLTTFNQSEIRLGPPSPPVPLNADFTANVTKGHSPLTVHFTDKSTGSGINKWQWEVAPGVCLNGQNVTYTYDKGGYYDVTLTVTDQDGRCDLATKSGYIIVNDVVADFTADITKGSAPLTVCFNDISLGTGIDSRDWTVAPGIHYYTQNITHTYNDAGQYDVTLTVGGWFGNDTEFKVNYITVTDVHHDDPDADFTANVTKGYAPLTVHFTDKSTGSGINKWKWKVAPKVYLYGQNVTHTYDKAGCYEVSLTVTDQDGSCDSEIKSGYITVTDVHHDDPDADFTANVTKGPAPLTVCFNDTSSGTNINKWCWTVAPGIQYCTRNITHTYDNIGQYDVTLKVEGQFGTDTVFKPDYITVTDVHHDDPDADFTANVTKGPAPLTVCFNDTSSGTNINKWCWTVAPGIQYCTRNITHTYDNIGQYDVTLKVEGQFGTDTVFKPDYINVISVLSPEANFTANVTEGSTPLAVCFNDTSLGPGINYWNWTVAPGIYLHEQNVTHIYNRSGLYDVSLEVGNEHGNSTETKLNYINVTGGLLPEANFTANVTEGSTPLAVCFNDTSLGPGINYWNWTVAPGIYFHGQNITHIYNRSGYYNVSLEVGNEHGNSTETKLDYINVTVGLLPEANFTANVTEGSTPLAVCFNDTSLGPGINYWNWTVAPGIYFHGQNITHIYNRSGYYNVSLEVGNEHGNSTETKLDYINVTVGLLPEANFTANVTEGSTPLAVCFNDTSLGPGINYWNWTVAPGIYFHGQNITHIYNRSGYYNVSLEVGNEHGNSMETKLDYINVTVGLLPEANFTANVTEGSTPLAVCFNDTSLGPGINYWNWTVAPGIYFHGQNITHIYNRSGFYNVSLEVGNELGNSTETKQNYINVTVGLLPEADFSANKTKGSIPLTVCFKDKSLGPGINYWNWTVAPGIHYYTQNITHTYNESGLYNVSLEVGNANGNSTGIKLNYINATLLPTADFIASPKSGYKPLKVFFTDKSTGNPDRWYWTFGDGATSTHQNSTHTYENAGTFTATLIVGNTYGNSTPLSADIVVNNRGGGGGGGGGGGYSSPASKIARYITTGIIKTDNAGIVQISTEIMSIDGNASLFLEKGVKALDKTGKPINIIIIHPKDDVPLPLASNYSFAGHAVEVLPSGATFEPPIDLIFNLTEEEWNALEGEQAFVIKWYNAETGEYEDIPTYADPITHTVTGKVSHFSIFALFIQEDVEPDVTQTIVGTTQPTRPVSTPTETPISGGYSSGDFPLTSLRLWSVIALVLIPIFGGIYVYKLKKK